MSPASHLTTHIHGHLQDESELAGADSPTSICFHIELFGISSTGILGASDLPPTLPKALMHIHHTA